MLEKPQQSKKRKGPKEISETEKIQIADAGELLSMYDGLEQYESERDRACFFTGHRRIIPSARIYVLSEMKNTVAYLYSIGVKEFHTGGARGFDTVAAAHILDMRKDHPDMKLILDLPYHNQTDGWSDREKSGFHFILENADSISYAYDGEVTNRADARKYLLQRNRIMADSCHYCIAYFSGSNGGTGYTIRYAESKKCEITNLYNKYYETKGEGQK